MMKPAEKPTKLLWLDLEMTGLMPDRDKILEVAAIVTDISLNELGSYHSLISHDELEIKKLLMLNPFWANRSDGLKKIIKEIKNGKAESTVQADLITLIGENFASGEPVYLAGNSIRVDRTFIDYWWPQFASKLHYRMLDVSSFKIWWTAKGKPEYKKQEKHRALDDIRESIAELKHYNQDIDFS